MSTEKHNHTETSNDSLLEKNLKVAEESLKLSQKIYRDIIYRRIFTAVKWTVIVILVVWGIIQLQPIIEQSTPIFNGIFETIGETPSN